LKPPLWCRAIIERLKEYGVPIDRVVCAGGIAEKNPLLMQIYADAHPARCSSPARSQAIARLAPPSPPPCSPARIRGFLRRAKSDDVTQESFLPAESCRAE